MTDLLEEKESSMNPADPWGKLLLLISSLKSSVLSPVDLYFPHPLNVGQGLFSFFLQGDT